jgi:hypothetical protein
METWLSGRKYLTANEASLNGLRGFESLRLRPIRMRLPHAASVFILIFCSSIALELWVTDRGVILDQDIWAHATSQVAQGQLPGPDDLTYGYPGTTIVLPAALLVRSGIDPQTAFTVTLMVLLASAIGGIAMMLYYLRPDSIWWLAGSSIFLFQRLLSDETPPSALITPLFTLLTLIILYLQQRPESRTAQYVFGILAGVALATRLDFSIMFLASASMFLVPILRKRIFVIMTIAGLVFVALDPFMFSPIQHAIHIFQKIHEHYYDKIARISVPWLARFFALSLFSVFFSLLLLFVAPKKLPVARSFLIWLILMTGGITALTLYSHYHPVWYFYPTFMIWEVFYPLFILSILAQDTESSTTSWIHAPILKYILLFSPALFQFFAIIMPIS